MKNIIIFSIAIFTSFSAFAATTLRIPVVTEEGTTPLAEVNQQLKDKGFDPLPPYFELKSENSKEAYEKYEEMNALFAHASKQLGEEIYWGSDTIPNEQNPGTCFIGEGGHKVVNLVFALAGSFYTEQMNLWGWKYKNQIELNEEYGSEGIGDTLNQQSEIWKSWSPKSPDMLIVLAHSDGGDDMNEVVIPVCK